MQEPMLLLHLLAMTIWPARRELRARRLLCADRVRERYEFDDAGRLTRLQVTGAGGEPGTAQLFHYNGKGQLQRIEHIIVRGGVEGDGGRSHTFQWQDEQIVESHDTGIHRHYEYAYAPGHVTVTAQDTREDTRDDGVHDVLEFRVDEQGWPIKVIERRGARVLCTSTFTWAQGRLHRFVRQVTPAHVLADVEIGWQDGLPRTVTYPNGVTCRFE